MKIGHFTRSCKLYRVSAPLVSLINMIGKTWQKRSKVRRPAFKIGRAFSRELGVAVIINTNEKVPVGHTLWPAMYGSERSGCG